MKRTFLIATLVAAFFSPISTFAEGSEMVIKDVGGVVRSVSQVDGETNIEFSVVDAANTPADGADILLKNQSTGEVVHAVSSHGTALFEHVPPGVYTVSSSASNIAFTNIVVGATAYTASAAAGFGVAGAVIGGGSVAAAGGATYALIDRKNNSRNRDRPLSPSR